MWAVNEPWSRPYAARREDFESDRSLRKTDPLSASYRCPHAFVKAHLSWTSGGGLVPVLEAGQYVDRRGGREEALHRGPRHAGVWREGPEGLVPVVKEV